MKIRSKDLKCAMKAIYLYIVLPKTERKDDFKIEIYMRIKNGKCSFIVFDKVAQYFEMDVFDAEKDCETACLLSFEVFSSFLKKLEANDEFTTVKSSIDGSGTTEVRFVNDKEEIILRSSLSIERLNEKLSGQEAFFIKYY